MSRIFLFFSKDFFFFGYIMIFLLFRETSLNSPLAVTGGSVLMNKTSLLSSIREESILDHKNTSYHR